MENLTRNDTEQCREMRNWSVGSEGIPRMGLMSLGCGKWNRCLGSGVRKASPWEASGPGSVGIRRVRARQRPGKAAAWPRTPDD